MRAKLHAFASMALRRGIAIEALDSLSALLDPSLVESVLDGYWKRDGETPRNGCPPSASSAPGANRLKRGR